MKKNIVSLKKEIALCPRCNRTLDRSDLPDYDYLCRWCDENFYCFEVREG